MASAEELESVILDYSLMETLAPNVAKTAFLVQTSLIAVNALMDSSPLSFLLVARSLLLVAKFVETEQDLQKNVMMAMS